MIEIKEILKKNKELLILLQIIDKLKLPNAYVGGGAVVQTVWNYIYGKEFNYGIDDYDIVYFDDKDLSEQGENKVILNIKDYLGDLNLKVDVKNEARVHLWYENRFNKKIKPYISTEDAISTWPTTATAIGAKLEKGKIKVFAPFGLNDLYNGIIRPNKALISKEIYDEKASKWHKKWPETKIIEW